MTQKLKILSALLLGSLSTTAMAQAEKWEGTWQTTYGEIKLVENNKHVWGDYGNWGTIQGQISNDETKLRGIYTRRDDGSSGYIEWVLNGQNSFDGRWTDIKASVPVWNRSGATWDGKRTNAAKPTLSVYTNVMGQNSFMARAPSQYRSWVSTNEMRNVAVPQSGNQNNARTANKYASRIPLFSGTYSDYDINWVEVKINRLGMGIDEARTYEIFGLMGIYAYCETPSGARPLKPYYNAKNNIMDRTRGDTNFGPIVFGANQAVRRFAFDEACLAQNGGRLSYQLQTNLKEKDTVPRTDEKWGYRSWKFYIEDLPANFGRFNRPDSAKDLSIERQESEKWEFKHVEKLNQGRFLGERIYIYGDVTVGR